MAVIGSVLITQTKEQKGGYSQKDIILGDLIAFLGSVFLGFNLQIISPLMQFYRDGIYMVQSNTAGMIVSYIALSLSDDTWYFSFDKDRGLFGFLHPSYFTLETSSSHSLPLACSMVLAMFGLCSSQCEVSVLSSSL